MEDWDKAKKWEEAKIGARLLGSAMREPGVMADLLAIGLTDGDFGAPTLSNLWKAAVPLYRAHKRLDPTSLEEHAALFEDEERAKQAVQMCLRTKPVNAVDEIPTLVGHMRRRVALRRLGRLALSLDMSAGQDDANPAEVIAQTIAEITDISTVASSISGANGHELGKIASDLLSGDRPVVDTVQTGIFDVDKALGGGLPVGNATLLVAGTGSGKSVAGRHVLLSTAMRGEPCLLFSFESNRSEVARDLTEAIAGVRFPIDMKNAPRETVSKLSSAAATLSTLPIYVEDTQTVTVEELCARVRAHKRLSPLRLVVIDYVQDIERSTKHGRDDLNFAHISRMLRQMAKTERLALFELSQVSAGAAAPGVRGKERLSPDDVASSRQFAKDAAAIITQERKRDDPDERKRNVSTVRVVKNRFFGAYAECWMRWDDKSARWVPSTKDGDSVRVIGGDEESKTKKAKQTNSDEDDWWEATTS